MSNSLRFQVAPKRRDEPSATENVQENSEKNVQGATMRSDSRDVASARGTSGNGSGTRSTDIRNSTGAKPAKNQRSSKTAREKSEKEERGPRRSKKEGQVDGHGGAAKRYSKGGTRESTRSKRKSRESDELRQLKEKYERKRKSKKGSIDVGDDLKTQNYSAKNIPLYCRSTLLSNTVPTCNYYFWIYGSQRRKTGSSEQRHIRSGRNLPQVFPLREEFRNGWLGNGGQIHVQHVPALQNREIDKSPLQQHVSGRSHCKRSLLSCLDFCRLHCLAWTLTLKLFTHYPVYLLIK
ncbi:unnamed protein product [Oikopleura dioica]|uniref:Uncharacterized protein n=1 Tax=Oikopleura dioica TaxID=34765 RepID=E4XGK9_OIKDI|nr:unnamed protein product [Oikopleura dioica]